MYRSKPKSKNTLCDTPADVEQLLVWLTAQYASKVAEVHNAELFLRSAQEEQTFAYETYKRMWTLYDSVVNTKIMFASTEAEGWSETIARAVEDGANEFYKFSDAAFHKISHAEQTLEKAVYYADSAKETLEAFTKLLSWIQPNVSEAK